MRDMGKHSSLTDIVRFFLFIFSTSPSLSSRRREGEFERSNVWYDARLTFLPSLSPSYSQTFIRALIALTSYAPLPPSALVTPVSFRVRFRNLKGILQEFDEHERGGPFYEDGGKGKGRELTGEWIVDKTLWARWQREYKQQGKGRRAREERGGQEETKEKGEMKGGDRIVLYLHGGESRMLFLWVYGEEPWVGLDEAEEGKEESETN